MGTAAKLAVELAPDRSALPPSAETIRKIAAAMPPGGNLRAAHLGNLAVSALKYVILYSESDDLKYQAARELLALPMVRRKMDALAASVQEHRPTGERGKASAIATRLRKLLEVDAGQATEVLALIEAAENTLSSTTDARQSASTTKETKENQ